MPGTYKKTDRPRANKFNAEMQDAYLELIAKGGRRCASMEALGMNAATLYTYLEDHPDFMGRIQKAECQASEQVANMLFENCKKGNIAAQIYWLQNRSVYKGEAEWQDRRKQDIKIQAIDTISSEEEKLLSAQRGLIQEDAPEVKVITHDQPPTE